MSRQKLMHLHSEYKGAPPGSPVVAETEEEEAFLIKSGFVRWQKELRLGDPEVYTPAEVANGLELFSAEEISGVKNLEDLKAAIKNALNSRLLQAAGKKKAEDKG